METSLNVRDYPEPEEMETKHVTAKVCISFEVDYDVPECWDKEQIEQDIVENIDDLSWSNQEIEDIIL